MICLLLNWWLNVFKIALKLGSNFYIHFENTVGSDSWTIGMPTFRSCLFEMLLQRKVKLFLTQPEATRGQSTHVPGAGVLIGSDWCELQHPLGPGPVNAHGPKVHKDQVVVSPPWNIQHEVRTFKMEESPRLLGQKLPVEHAVRNLVCYQLLVVSKSWYIWTVMNPTSRNQ